MALTGHRPIRSQHWRLQTNQRLGLSGSDRWVVCPGDGHQVPAPSTTQSTETETGESRASHSLRSVSGQPEDSKQDDDTEKTSDLDNMNQ